MKLEDVINYKQSFLKKLIKRCVTDKFPMVKDVEIKTGKERCDSLLIPYPYIYYHSIFIVHHPDKYCESTYNEICNEIKPLLKLALDGNEHLKSFWLVGPLHWAIFIS